MVKKTSATKKTPATKEKILGTCLVMMPFKEPYNLYYETIFKSAIQKANLTPELASDLFRPSPIVGDLWQMIQNSKLLLAELTTKNANVFYELGLAHAIGKPVILVAETMDDVPFDLQSLRILLYDKNDPAWCVKLTKSIISSIKETLAEPIKSVPSMFLKAVESQAPEQDKITTRLNGLESQIRMLRRRPSIKKSLIPDWEKDLESVSNEDAFSKWVKRWVKRGISVNALEAAILDNDDIPSEEIDRIPMVLAKKS